MISTGVPETLAQRITDSRQDAERYFMGCLVAYYKNDGTLNIGRLIEISLAGDGNHSVRLETPQTNWAVPGYRPRPFRVAASRVRADCNFTSAYFNAGDQGSQVAWYCAMNGSRSVVKGVPASDQGSLYTLTDYNHSPLRTSPHPQIMASYVRHQLGLVTYPTVEQALAALTREDGVPAIAVHKDIMLSAFYNNEGETSSVTISSCGLPLLERIPLDQVKQVVEELL